MPLLELSAERPLPGSVYLCLRHKMIRYRNGGDTLDADSFNKLVYNHVKYVFIEEPDRDAFNAWFVEGENSEAAAISQAFSPETQEIVMQVATQRRAMMDIFENPKDDKAVKEAVEVSKKLVTEFLRKPFAINNISALQKHSKGAVDHSVNVSVLSVFLGLRMGYTHQIILENLAMGGLFHDIGKMLVETSDEGMTDENDPAMQQHPKLGQELLEKSSEVANEVRMIVAQHHEFLDGSGYPNGLKGLAVYDLARLVAIANIYDNLITKSKLEGMKERQVEAVDILERDYADRLDAKKLEKVVKILRYSFL
ncbi:MAG: HD domain-containing protein [Deltaproteobacteria bacterium]|nr:HD domain-containing protein [Deltaproteobacteria bacterium]